jgi:arginine repressor
LKEIAGTIAGDDTLLLVIREGFSRDDLIGALGKLFRQIDKKRLN